MNKFLDKYDTLIFDMDGVVTSESGYWDAAALTVYEYLMDEKYFGNGRIDTASLSGNVKNIRSEVFSNDELIVLLKGKGVNSNWDLGYITVLMSLILGTTDFGKIYKYAEKIDEDIILVYENFAKLAAEQIGVPYEEYCRNGKLWCDMRDCFQEWYLGDDMFMKTYGKPSSSPDKPGLYKKEVPITTLDELRAITGELSQTKRLGIATGRLEREILPLLSQWEVLSDFDETALSTYDYVIKGEADTGATLTKPHPYMFLKALYGVDYPDQKLIDGDYDKSKIEKTLIVGDAGADILGAKAMGADFCAVLTGVAGQKGRAYFEEQNSEYILNDIRELI